MSDEFEDQFGFLEEQKLIKILQKNKLLRKFARKLDEKPHLKNRLFSKFSELNQLIIDEEAIQKYTLNEFIRISRKLTQQDINLLLTKSTGEFPYESSNIDCLIEPDKLATTTKILQEEDYQEYPTVREPHKYLFRKKNAPKELPLHIHTRVEWEAIEFANPDNLRRRARFLLDKESGALIPSVEDAFLITIAHYFFEDHEIKINDLLKLCCMVGDEKIDWDYLFSQAQQLCWKSALLLNFRILNNMSLQYFGKAFFPDLDEKRFLDNYRFFSRANHYGTFKIPYAVSASFFLEKILRAADYSLKEKSKQITYVVSDVIGRRILGYDELT